MKDGWSNGGTNGRMDGWGLVVWLIGQESNNESTATKQYSNATITDQESNETSTSQDSNEALINQT